jgi:hypothetical protein
MNGLGFTHDGSETARNGLAGFSISRAGNFVLEDQTQYRNFCGEVDENASAFPIPLIKFVLQVGWTVTQRSRC